MNNDFYTITREIGIDAGHRVMTHGSKCKNLHGHRYRIEVMCATQNLISEGEQQAMVLDFGFLKELMMKHIDEPCDHGMIMYIRDPLIVPGFLVESIYEQMVKIVREDGHGSYGSFMGKLYLVDFIPTAEELAKHWFNRLKQPVSDRSNGCATLASVTVHETPNCRATYSEPVRYTSNG